MIPIRVATTLAAFSALALLRPVDADARFPSAAAHSISTAASRARHVATVHASPPGHAGFSPIENVAAIATLSPVLDTAESLRKLSVKHTYECKLTAYGPGYESTGKNPGDPGYGVTASGRPAKPLHTVAVDPRLIPLGSLLYIDGVGYRVAEDVGGAIKGTHIDLYFPYADQAKLFGVKRHVKVYVFGHTPLIK